MAKMSPPFGKFGQPGQHPIQIWEPFDQEAISEIAETYRSLGVPRRLDFATNEDPVQKQLYLAPYAGPPFRLLYHKHPGI